MNAIIGTIVGIQGHGTIVSLTIAETWEQVKNDVGRLVHFDHTPFRHLIEAVADGDPRQLLGRRCRVTGAVGEQVIELDPDDEPVCRRCEEPSDVCTCTEEDLEQHDCFEQGHCGCADCRHKGFCCSCGGEIDNEPCGEYDTTAERDLDRAIDAYNDSRRS